MISCHALLSARFAALSAALLAGLLACGCAGSMGPDAPPQPTLPQPQPNQPNPSKPDGTGWVCNTDTCGGRCENNVCYPKNYSPPDPANPTNPPSTGGNCPAPSDVIGSYEGSISGNIKSVIDVQVVGKVNFSVVDDGNGGLSITSGTIFGKALGINFNMPMAGSVVCGKLSGTGTGKLVGYDVDGTFTATFTASSKAFAGGTWSGIAPANGSTGGGDWDATRL